MSVLDILKVKDEQGNWHTIPALKGEKGETGDTGPTGPQGPQGATGAAGADGVSPEVTITEIEGGHQVKITDKDHPIGQTFNVMDGQGGGGAVASVNGKTGVVVLSAEDVGALPYDTVIPTALSDLTDDATHRLVTDTEKSTWNEKGTYSKPSTGIPKTDLASAVQTSLGLADTALQSHQDISGKIDKSAQATKTSTMTQAVGIDSNGKLWTSPGGGGTGAVSSVNGMTGDVTLNAANVGALPDDTVIPTKTSDLTNDSGFLTEHQSLAAYRTSADQDTIDAGKVDKVDGKGLSTNDYTTSEKNKLAGIAEGAEVNVQSDWNQTNTSADDFIKNKPTIPSAVTESTVAGWGFTKNTGTYSKPSSGIPKTDLASAVQSSLNKADSALQTHQSLDAYRTSAAQDVIDAGFVGKFDLLWENASPESEFAQQTITVNNLSQYDVILIRISVINYLVSSGHIFTNLILTYDNEGFVIDCGAFYRVCALNGNTINISQPYSSSDGTEANIAICIPYKIYGAKYGG